MSEGIYEEVEIEDMAWDADSFTYFYPCPCGDKFSITLEELFDGEDIATCPSCTLRVRVIFQEGDLPELPEEEEEGEEVSPMGEVPEAPAVGDIRDENDCIQVTSSSGLSGAPLANLQGEDK